MEVTDTFYDYFGESILRMIDEETSVVYGLSADLRLSLLNNAWFTFACENEAPPEFFTKYGLGGAYLAAVPSVLESFFESNIRSSIERRRPWTFDYQCPTPTYYQEFRMHVLPMARGLGCIVSNGRLLSVPHSERGHVASPTFTEAQEVYSDETGMVTICVNCRRTRHLGPGQRWEWVPAFIERPPQNVTHGICPSCLAYFSAQAELS